MSRYIDLDEIRKLLDACPNKGYVDMDEIPPADVQPVVHGHWERMEDDCCFWFECSNCRNYPPIDAFKHEWLSPFCPVCGAEMDAERREE